MVDVRTIKMQLAAIDADLPFWVSAERKQLSNILVTNEVINHVVAGRYEGGFALLCATNLRMLIIDKKPMFLTVEDVRYDMIAEVNFSHQLLDSSIHLSTVSKELWFSSFRKQQLKDVTDYIQHKLTEARQAMETTDQPNIISNVLDAKRNELSDGQAREILPNTQQAWDRVTQKLNTINSYPKDPRNLVRRRITKFDTFQ
ncbi:PH domain-containing protein [Candidatus Saccharibacteria bacterium]|nr:PH domain-containing protein [Candidatus Saccharibacteria bacterium]